MKVLDPGHDYELDVLDGDFTIHLTFVKRKGESYPGNMTDHPGTNMQEVLRALIDRCKYVNRQIRSGHTMRAILYLRDAFYELESRAAVRHNRGMFPIGYFDKVPIEEHLTCSKCGHIDSNNRKGKVFCCTSCGTVENADVNAGFNIASLYQQGISQFSKERDLLKGNTDIPREAML